MSAWLIALIIFVSALAAAFLLPSRIRLHARLRGAFVRGEARVGLLYGVLGITLCFSACKNAAGRYEARVWRRNRPERIYTLPIQNEVLGVIRKELGKRSAKKAQEQKPEARPGIRPKSRPFGKAFRSRWLRALLTNASIREARISGTLGTGNAAATALLLGAISGAVKAILAPAMNAPPSIAIEPDFSQPVLNLELACIVNLSHGKSTLESI